MTGKRMVALDFAGSRLLEPLGRTLMGLQLRHKIKFLDLAGAKRGSLKISTWNREYPGSPGESILGTRFARLPA
jgi:hypothetical protein